MASFKHCCDDKYVWPLTYIFYDRIAVKRNRICFEIINTCLFYVTQNTFTARESWQTCPSLPRRRVRQNWDHCLWDSGLSKFMQRLYKRIRYSNILWCLNDLGNTNMGNIGFFWAVKLNYKVPFTFESTKSSSCIFLMLIRDHSSITSSCFCGPTHPPLWWFTVL